MCVADLSFLTRKLCSAPVFSHPSYFVTTVQTLYHRAKILFFALRGDCALNGRRMPFLALALSSLKRLRECGAAKTFQWVRC